MIKRADPRFWQGLSVTAATLGFLSMNLSCDAGKVQPQSTAEAPAAKPRLLAAKPDKAGTVRNGIRVVYPPDKSDIAAPSTFIVGAVDPGSSLTVNGATIAVNPQGYFAHVVPLRSGENKFLLVKNGQEDQSYALTVKRPLPPQPVPTEPLQILRSSVEPKQELGVEVGDIIQFAMRGSPGSKATVRIGNKTIPMQPAGPKVNSGLDTAFGVTYQRSPATINDMYWGFYRITALDAWQGETPVFTLSRDGNSVSETASSHITVLQQPLLSSTVTEDTIVRVGPGAGRTTPWPAGVRLLIDGFTGDNYRCEVAPNKHLWIEKKDLGPLEDSGLAPRANVRTINIENENRNGARIVIPLTQRLPFEVRQEITPANRLLLKIYGATADTDWITEPTTRSDAATPNPATQTGRSYPPATGKNPVSFVTWQQLNDSTYQVTVNVGAKQQWGYWAEYQDNNLVLHVKGAPHLAPNQLSLQGLKVCVDPGHGGNERGAIGCGGVKEAAINLGIGLKLAEMLKAEGADVILTRDSDSDVSLRDRVEIANKAGADLLISVHGNSLPDGRNPLIEHGTSSYYYHPQSLNFASALRQGAVNTLGFPNFNTRWQNLALCRPSRMPAALVEVGFVINPDEYTTLISDAGQTKAARGIVSGVHHFLNEALAVAPPHKKNPASAQPKRGSNR